METVTTLLELQSLAANHVEEYCVLGNLRAGDIVEAISRILQTPKINTDEFEPKTWGELKDVPLGLTYGDLLTAANRFDYSYKMDCDILMQEGNTEKGIAVQQMRSELANFVRYLKLIADNKNLQQTPTSAE